MGLGLGVALVGGASLLGGAWLHLDLPVSRRIVQQSVNDFFASQFVGRVTLGPIGEIAPGRIVVARFEVHDPDGTRLLDVEDITIAGAWLGDVLALALSGGDATLALDRVRIERGYVGIVRHEGELRLARAFGSRAPPPPPDAPPSEPPDFALRVGIVELGEVAVGGDLGDALPLDASVSRVHARLSVSPSSIEVDVADSAVSEQTLLGAPATGSADFHLRGRRLQQADADIQLWGAFAGHVGQLELSARATVDGDEVAVLIDLPKVGPDELAPWLPTRPLQRAVSARATLHGKPPLLALEGEVRMPGVAGEPPGSIAMQGHFHGDRALVDADITVRGFDARLFGAELPATRLDADLRVGGRLAGAASELAVTLRMPASAVDEVALPPIEGRLLVTQPASEARLVVFEEGGPLDVRVRYTPEGGVRFAVSGDVPRLDRAPRLVALATPALGPLSGRARIRAEGSLQGDALDVVAQADVVGLRVPAQKLRIDSASARGRVTGSIADSKAMRVDARIRGGGLAVDAQRAERFDVGVVGPILHPTVNASLTDDQAREITARGRVDTQRRRLTNMRVGIARGDDSISGEIGVIDSGRGLRIEGIALQGLGGEVKGALDVKDGELSGQLSGSGIELGPLSRLLGLPQRLRGTAAVDIDISRDERGRSGHAKIALNDVGVLILGGVNASLEVAFDGHKIAPRGSVSLSHPVPEPPSEPPDPCAGKYLDVAIDESQLYLPGRLLDGASWRDLSGTMAVSLREAELRCIAELVDSLDPLTPLPLSQVEGTIAGSAVIALGRGQTLPSLEDVSLRTRGLKLAGPIDTGDVPAWRSDRLDIALTGSFDGSDGASDAEIAVKEHVPASRLAPPIVSLSATAGVDLDAALAGGARARQALEHMPISLKLRMSRTSAGRLAALPSPLRERIAGVRGDVDIDAFVEGTPRDPSASLRVRMWDVKSADLAGPDSPVARWDLPTELDLIASYSAGVGRLDGSIGRRGELLATLSGESKGNLSARVLGGEDPRWSGWLDLQLRGVPLETLPGAADAGVSGALSGHVMLRDLGIDPHVKAKLTVPALRVGDVVIERASLVIDREAALQTIDLRLPVSKTRGLRLAGFGSLAWEDRLYPAPDYDRPAGLSLKVDAFPLRSIQPLLGQNVSRVGGTIDGEATVHYEDGGASTSVDVDLTIDDAAIHLPGQELHGIHARVHSHPGLLRIDEISASAGDGRATGYMLMRFDGLAIRDLTGAIEVKPDTPMPLALDGTPVGSVSGNFMVMLTQRGAKKGHLTISSANLQVVLPPSARRDVQELADHPDVTVSHPLAPPEVDVASVDMGFDITIALANAKVVGNQLAIELGTNPAKPLMRTGGGELTGEILISGGELSLLDKTFRIERGVVRMGDEPGNPYVNVTAYWNAPDGSTVFVDYVGLVKPLTEEKIRFRSSPPRTQGEILSLMLLGDAGAESDDPTQTSDKASALGRGIAAQQLNGVLGQVAPGLSTRFGASDGYLSTTVAYQVSDDVTLSATYDAASSGGAVEQQGAEQTTSPAQSDRRSIAVDWRFARKWLLRGSFGVGETTESGLDLLFQHRY